MSLTPAQLAKIRQKQASMPDALKRDPNVNYYEGWFFVTLKTRDNVPILSYCVGNVQVGNGLPDAPRCEYTEMGQRVIRAWKEMPTIHPYVEIDLCEAMPDHFHGLVHLLPGNKRHLGHLIGGFMGGCSHAYWDLLGIDWQCNRYDKGASALRVDRDQDHTHSLRGPALFVHGYNDIVAISDQELEIKREYIRNQARKRLIQGENHACFVKHRNQHSKNWTLERIAMAISTDRCFRHNDARCEQVLQHVASRLKVDEKGLCLDFIGNTALLSAPRKLSLICHSADSYRFEQQKQAVLRAAKEGAVIVSAFISPRERDIKLQLMKELLPFIEVMDNGISEKYKGVGKVFYALAENRLCQITPWHYLYARDFTVTREFCLVMNELVRLISGVKDDWWSEKLE